MRFDRSTWLACVMMIVGGAVASAQREPREMGAASRAHFERPNIIFIMADDMGWGDLASYGHPHINTPHLDALASEGILFTRYYACSSVCSPARAAILTGRFPAESGVHAAINSDPNRNAQRGQVDWLATSPELLARRLRDAGYATGHFGKWHLGEASGAPSLDDYGFDVHRSRYSGSGNPKYYDFGTWKWTSSEEIVADSIAFIEDHAGSPFYLQVWLEHPHSPLDPTPEQAAEYSGDVTAPGIDHGWTSARHCYMSAVTAMDQQIGMLLASLEPLGIEENTLVVFVSDNGPESQYSSTTDHSGAGHAGPFRGRKRSLYEGGVRVPCIARWPAVTPAGRIEHGAVAAVDWLPTFLTMAGAEPVELADGESLIPALWGQGWERTRPLFFEWRFGRPAAEERIASSPGGGIMVGDFKLLRNRDGSRVELYDLSTDPMEVDNVASAHPDLVASLSASLVDWQATLGPCVGCQNEGDNSYPWPE